MIVDKPRFGWTMFAKRMLQYANTQPHHGFQIILNLIKKHQLDYFVLTSNIDGHFQKAGFEEQKVREVHGSIWHLQSVNPKVDDTIWDNNLDLETLQEDILRGNYPLSPNSFDLARPNVYMFRDNTYVPTRSHEQRSHFDQFLFNNTKKKIVVLEIGAGTHVQTIRIKTRMLKTHYGAKIIRINPFKRGSKLKPPHIHLENGALEALELIEGVCY